MGGMKKRKKKTGRLLARLLLIALVAAMVSPFHLGNGYLPSLPRKKSVKPYEI